MRGIKIKQTETSTNPINGKIPALVLTIMILVMGTFFYFTAINNPADMAVPSPQSTKAYPPGEMLSNNEFSNDKPMLENRPETSVGVGSNARPDTEFMSPDVPDVKTSSANSIFNHLLQEDKMYTKKNAEGVVKLFYQYTKEGEAGDNQIKIQLEEGNIYNYQIHTIGGQNYYPLILGYEEAKMMRDEDLFTEIGDPIKDFFGKNVVVVGIMKKTNGVLDLAYLIPLNSGELN